MNHVPLSASQTIAPLQPHLKHLYRYKRKIIKWNPYTVKNLALCYQFETGVDGHVARFIPDGCLEFFFCCNKDNPVGIVKGIQTEPQNSILVPNSVYFGFKPYSTKGMRQFAINWAELADSQIPLKELITEINVAENLATAKSFEERVKTVLTFVLNNLVDESYTPDFVEYTALRVCNTRGNIKVKEISDYTGYSDRYCLKKFKEAYGISIKNYSNIMRFQNVVRMLSSNHDDNDLLSDIVFENGYFDQSHLNREFRRYANNSPLSFKRGVLDNVSLAQ